MNEKVSCMQPRSLAFAAALVGTLIFSLPAQALEPPIGVPQNVASMQVEAAYLQPIEMQPGGHVRKMAESDIHLKADIHALGSNVNGYAKGCWMPFLLVKYELSKQGAGEAIQGDRMPMVASDGPHDGDNVKLAGIGKKGGY